MSGSQNGLDNNSDKSLENNSDRDCSSDLEQEIASDRNNTTGIQEKLLKLKLGRGRGRPRKITRITNFFDFALKNKKKCRSYQLRLGNTTGKNDRRKSKNNTNSTKGKDAHQDNYNTQERELQHEDLRDLSDQILEASQLTRSGRKQ